MDLELGEGREARGEEREAVVKMAMPVLFMPKLTATALFWAVTALLWP